MHQENALPLARSFAVLPAAAPAARPHPPHPLFYRPCDPRPSDPDQRTRQEVCLRAPLGSRESILSVDEDTHDRNGDRFEIIRRLMHSLRVADSDSPWLADY